MNKQGKVIDLYLKHMCNKVIDLYVLFSINPFKLIEVSEVPGTLEYEAQEVLKAIMKSYLLLDLVHRVKNLVKEAERQVLMHRYFETYEDWSIRGSLIWSLIPMNIAKLQPPPQLIISRTIASPENVLLRIVLDLLISQINQLVKIVEYYRVELIRKLGISIEYTGFQSIMNKLKNASKELENLVKRSSLLKILPRHYRYLPLVELVKRLLTEIEKRPWRPKWVEELIAVARMSLELNRIDVKVLIYHPMIEKIVLRAKYVLRLLSWRLYELYILYLVLKALKELSTRSRLKHELSKEKEIVLIFDSHSFVVFYNSRPRIDSEFLSNLARGKGFVVKNGLLSIEELRKYSGRPDITIITNFTNRTKVIVFEAKFTRNPSYLLASKHKLLAYAYEFKADKAILTYPGISTPKKYPILEDEDRTTIELLEKAEKNYGIEIKTDNKTTLYMLPIKPTNKLERKYITILKRIFRNNYE